MRFIQYFHFMLQKYFLNKLLPQLRVCANRPYKQVIARFEKNHEKIGVLLYVRLLSTFSSLIGKAVT